MPVQIVHTADKLAEIITYEPYVLVDFYAEWCKPCMKGGPIFEQISNESRYSHIKFVKINIDNLDDDLKMEYGINSIPLLKYYRNNTIVCYKNGLSKNIINSMLLT